MPSERRALETAIDAAIRARTSAVVAPDTSFFDAGLTSATILELHDDLQQRIGEQFAVAAFFRHPTVRALAVYLAADPADRPSPVAPSTVDREPGWRPNERRALRARLWQRTG
jgi:acyl carrier protein